MLDFFSCCFVPFAGTDEEFPEELMAFGCSRGVDGVWVFSVLMRWLCGRREGIFLFLNTVIRG